MKPLVIYPTFIEAQPFIELYGGRFNVAVCGMGIACRDEIERLLADERPDVAVLAGTAGAYDGSGLETCDTVIVKSENGIEYAPAVLFDTCRQVASLTVERATEAPATNPYAEIENMEGSYFFELCARYSVPSLEVRVVSNEVGAPRSRWQIPRASQCLARKLVEILETLETI